MKKTLTIARCSYSSPLGPMTLAAHETALVGAWFDGQAHQPDPAQWPVADQHPVLQEAAQQLEAFFECQRKYFELPLDLSAGTPFQQLVWRNLLAIQPGEVCSYGELSARIGKPGAVRAVGAAIGRNPLSIVVPCHRVVGAKGALTGYAGGLQRKAALLAFESQL